MNLQAYADPADMPAEENRSAILIVPSVVARMERNVVVNGRHPDFEGLTVGLETPVWWGERLFR